MPAKEGVRGYNVKAEAAERHPKSRAGLRYAPTAWTNNGRRYLYARVRFLAVGHFQPRGHWTLARLKESSELREFLRLN
jgi:hypothetical protein